MPVTRGRKALLIGLDSITPVMVDRMLAEGAMPNLQRLIDRGWSSEVVPTMPPTTPAAWTTVATGAWPSTHGIEGFAVHRQGHPLDRKVHSLTSDGVRSEQLWQLAERHGLDSVLLKYPVPWPPTGGPRVTQADGAGGWGGLKCVHDLVHSGCWDTHPESAAAPVEGAMPQEWMTRDADNLDEEGAARIVPAEVAAWSGLPEGLEAAFAGTLPLRARNGTTATVHVLAGTPDGEDRVLVAGGPDAGRSAAPAGATGSSSRRCEPPEWSRRRRR